MTGQGLLGALDQYWSVEPKARLHRKNTVFDEYPTNEDALKVGIVRSVQRMLCMKNPEQLKF